ncbi:MAG TPA: M56 family metallopeptidase, partial [Longimicrobiaceae bacterium]|nr:M56 family metallopeptidase [Longimicrobiaceae bacterium]
MSTILDTFRAPLFQALGWGLVHFLWQGVIVAVATRALLAAFRGASSTTRYAIACAGMLAMAAAPVVTTATVLRSGDPSPSVEATAGARPFTLGAPGAGGDAAIGAAETGEVRADGRTSAAGSGGSWMERARTGVQPWLPLVVLAWLVGVAIGAVRLAGAWLHLRRLRTRWATEVAAEWNAVVQRLVREMGIPRPVRLLESARIRVPAVMGALKPVILVPAGLLVGLAPQEVELILAHELAHVRRWDYVVNLAQSLLETVLFFHPAVWWLSGVVRDEREHCCDDAVVGATRQGKRYARALLAAEDLRAAGPGPMLAPALGGGSLLRRVRRIVAPGTDVPAGGGLGPALTVLGMAALLMGGTPLSARERGAV